tara:strand:+ start:15028 stop:15138 length:111 start_codon:yes stop_codon:yes gene_type:complete
MYAAEKAMDDVTEFMTKKKNKHEQQAFLEQVLFGLS